MKNNSLNKSEKFIRRYSIREMRKIKEADENSMKKSPQFIGLGDRSILKLTKERLKAKEEVPDEITF